MTTGALGQVAAWDPGGARRAVLALAGVADRLPPWRSRVDAVGRALGAPGGWSGPAAAVAVEAVAELSAVAVALGAALHASLEQLQRVPAHAETAQPLAARALTLTDAGAGLPLDGGLEQVLAAAALTEDALSAAALAAGAAAGAAAALPPASALHPVDAFGDLAARLGASAGGAVPAVPVAAAPGEVAGWWAGLPLGAQLAAVRGCPELVGDLDGVPAWARDRANRELLDRALAAPEGPGSAGARTVSGALTAEELRGAPVQLLEFDAATGRVAVVLGDLDTASDVGVLVPGMGTTVTGGLGPLLADARGVRDAALTATPAAAVATVAWLGYRPPRWVAEADNTIAARRGGALLDRTLTGLRASRRATGGPAARTTVLAHSYGTLVAGEAARRPGRLAADAVVLMGSPGIGLRGAGALEAPEVYAAGSLGDPVSYLGRFGLEPTVPWFGATRLPTDTWETHGSYYDPRHPTLAALGRVVAGTEPHR